MSVAFRVVAVIYLVGVIAYCVMTVHGIYVSGGFQRERTAADFLLVMTFYGMAAAIWPAFVALLIMDYLGALPHTGPQAFFKLPLLVVLFASMAIFTWAVTHMASPTKYALHAKWRKRLVPLIGSHLIELKTSILAFLVGAGSILGFALL
jgi:hypothetical protein